MARKRIASSKPAPEAQTGINPLYTTPAESAINHMHYRKGCLEEEIETLEDALKQKKIHYEGLCILLDQLMALRKGH